MMTSAISTPARAYSEISMPLSFRERFLFLLALILLSFSIRQTTLGERLGNVGERLNRDRSEIIPIRRYMSTTLIGYRSSRLFFSQAGAGSLKPTAPGR